MSISRKGTDNSTKLPLKFLKERVECFTNRKLKIAEEAVHRTAVSLQRALIFDNKILGYLLYKDALPELKFTATIFNYIPISIYVCLTLPPRS